MCQFSALCICTLLLMLIIQLTAHAIQLTAHASASAQAFTCFSCTCTTSRSLEKDAYIDILHNSQGLLFHPRAVTPLGSSPRTRFYCRCVRALRVLSLMCMCSCFHMGSYSHCTHEVSRKSNSLVACLLFGFVVLVVVLVWFGVVL